MESGEFDIYPEYTGTAWNMVLKEEGVYSEDLFGELQQRYNEDYDMQWIGMYGFNNTYGLVVRREIAEQYDCLLYTSTECSYYLQAVFIDEAAAFGRPGIRAGCP